MKVLTDDQKREALKHIKYEVDMVNGLSAKLESGELDGDPVLKNACLESIVIHLRSLDAFLEFQGNSQKLVAPDDVTAHEFCGQYNQPKRSSASNDARNYANKCVAHQTTKRADGLDSGWQAWLSEIKVAYDIWRSSISFGAGGAFPTDPGELNPPPPGPLSTGQTNDVSSVKVTSLSTPP